MIIGIPKEIKENEYRIMATPSAVLELCNKNHQVYLENNAGLNAGYSNEEYLAAGAQIKDRDFIFKNSELIYKVKEIFPEEVELMQEGQIVLTYLHSNAHLEMTQGLLEKKIIGIAYEDVIDMNGGFPLLKTQSELAGKGGFIAAMQYMQSINGGAGLLLSNIAGVETPVISIIGAGSSGLAAAEFAASLGNRVNILDVNRDYMYKIKNTLPNNVNFLYSNRENIVKVLKESDVIINCILWNKNRKDHLINKEDLAIMKKSALIVDVACDDNGAIESCHSTTHADPIYFEEGIMHYCVDNIPSAFSKTASVQLSSTTLPYLLNIANNGIESALKNDAGLRRGLTFYLGKLSLEETATKFNLSFVSPDDIVSTF